MLVFVFQLVTRLSWRSFLQGLRNRPRVKVLKGRTRGRSLKLVDLDEANNSFDGNTFCLHFYGPFFLLPARTSWVSFLDVLAFAYGALQWLPLSWVSLKAVWYRISFYENRVVIVNNPSKLVFLSACSDMLCAIVRRVLIPSAISDLHCRHLFIYSRHCRYRTVGIVDRVVIRL